MDGHPMRSATDSVPLRSFVHEFGAIVLNMADATLPASLVQDLASVAGALRGTHASK
jgi:hypothetical protein